MRKLKKNICMLSVLLIVLGSMLLVLCNWRHVYRPEDRTPLESGFFSHGGSQGIGLSVKHADIIVVGTVKDNGTNGFRRYLSANPNITLPDGIGYEYTKYIISVDELWGGACEDSKITLYLTGNTEYGIVKPRRNDKLILFVEEGLDPDTNEKYYYTVNAEKSIYVINPFGKGLFAFSTDPESMKYDGMAPTLLKEDVEEKMEEFAERNSVSEISMGDATQMFISKLEKTADR